MPLTLYHGSEQIIGKPEFCKGRKNNDYGQGFYLTDEIDLAKEWAVEKDRDGYINCYELNLENLNVLDLNSTQYSIFNWIAMLASNRKFNVYKTQEVVKLKFLDRFFIDLAPFDAIKGYRADDRYFNFAKAFFNNILPANILKEVFKLGNLGRQYCIKSQKAFDNIVYVENVKVSNSEWYVKRIERNDKANDEYNKLVDSLNERRVKGNLNIDDYVTINYIIDNNIFPDFLDFPNIDDEMKEKVLSIKTDYEKTCECGTDFEKDLDICCKTLKNY